MQVFIFYDMPLVDSQYDEHPALLGFEAIPTQPAAAHYLTNGRSLAKHRTEQNRTEQNRGCGCNRTNGSGRCEAEGMRGKSDSALRETERQKAGIKPPVGDDARATLNIISYYY
ncbi:hypothetical protein D3C87_1142100 [compost metagenome]